MVLSEWSWDKEEFEKVSAVLQDGRETGCEKRGIELDLEGEI